MIDIKEENLIITVLDDEHNEKRTINISPDVPYDEVTLDIEYVKKMQNRTTNKLR